MTPKRRLLPLLVALLVWGNLNSAHASADFAPESSPASSASPSSSHNAKNPVPSVIIDEAGSRRISSAGSGQAAPEQNRLREPPGSPVNLFMPDEFQFYTLNGNGQLVMKQMTKQEIQSMIAAGGGGAAGAPMTGGTGNLPVDLGQHQSQLSGDAVPKVSDVVQNVQKVLKGELNKPVKVQTSGSSIPGSVNSQWTNMLPYILSGGSVDQQDVSQDTSIILPALDDDDSYIDVVPLQGNKPTENQYEPGPNYVQLPPTTHAQEIIKPATHKPTKGTSEKPIYLLGNMALDSGILGEQETYTLPTKISSRPSRPSSTPVYHKYTTTRPSVISIVKDIAANSKKNSTGNKPTLYIPLSVSSSLLEDTQNQDNYGSLDLPSYGFKTNQQEQDFGKLPDSSADSTTISSSSAPTKKTTSYVYPDEPGFTRVPMIQVPVISADKIITSTQRTNQQQTPMFEKLPAISPASVTSTTVKESPSSHPTKVNLGPMGGFKQPETSHRPSTTYHPVYEPLTKPSTAVNVASTTRRPVYEPVTKPSTVKVTTPTYHPVYRPVTTTSTRRPVYEAETKTSSAVTFKPAFSRRPVYETTTTKTSESAKVTQYPGNAYQTYTTGKASSPVLEIVTKPSTQTEGTKVTKYPGSTYTTGKASTPVLEVATKPTTQSEALKVTKYPESTYQTMTTGKASSPVIEIVTKPTTLKEELEVTKNSVSVPETTIKDEAQDLSPVYVVQQLLNSEKYPTLQAASQSLENSEFDISQTNEEENDSYNYYEKLPAYNNSEVNKNEGSTESYNTYNYDKSTVTYPDMSDKLPEKTTDYTELNKDSYLPDKGSDDMSYTVEPVKAEIESEQSTLNYYNTEKPIQLQEIDTATSSSQQSVKTDESTTYEDSLLPSAVTIQSEESSTNYYTQTVQNVPETTFKPTDNTLNELAETITPNSEINSVKPSDIIESKDQSEVPPANDNKSEVNKDTYNIDASEKNNPDELPTTMYINKAEPTQSSSKSEITTQFSPINEDITEIFTIKYDSENLKNDEEQPILMTNTYGESTIINQETTTKPIKDSSTTYKTEFTEQTTVYTPPINIIVDSEESTKDNTNVKPSNTSDITAVKETTESAVGTSENSIIESQEMVRESSTLISTDTTKEFNEKITIPSDNSETKLVEEKKPTTEFSTNETTNLVTEYEKPIKISVSEKENNKAALPLEDKIMKPVDQDQTKLVTETMFNPTIKYSTVTPDTAISLDQSNKNTSKDSDVTPIYEKVETITENVPEKQTEKIKPSIFTTEINSDNNNKIQVQEAEVSTVKVIPVYDDDTAMYTILPDKPSEVTFTIPTSTVQSSEKDKPEANTSLNLSSSSKTTQSAKPSITATPATTIYTTQGESIRDTVLPGLQETFNNYMKEHYDPNLSSTGNYDEISYMTTFPAEINKDYLSNKNKLPTLPTTIPDYITSDQPDRNTGTESLNIQSSTPVNNLKNTDNSKPEQKVDSITQNTIFKETYSTDNSGDKQTIFTTKHPVTHNKNKVETPIIYLDLTSPDSDKQSISHHSNKDYMSNSSLTRIKIKNPVMDIDKIISEAQAQTNTPSTVYYTLPSDNKPPNNFASGLIAGYPTYNQVKPVTEQVPGTTLYEIIGGTKKPSLNKKPVQVEPHDNEQSETNVSYQGKPTTILAGNDEKYVEKTSFRPTSSADMETTIYNYQTSETPNYESYTQIPFESLPIASKPQIPSQSGESYDPPLEKINDLINQLKNTPSEHAPIGYDYSNGVETTIVPLDRFETLITESNTTPNDDTLTTIFNDLSKTSTESQNNTYVVIQTLPASKPLQSSTEPSVRYTTINEPTTIESRTETTTSNISKTKPTSIATTVLTIVKQPVTGKPYVTSTYSTTKGSLDKIQSTIDKSAGRINLEEEKNKIQQMKPTEPTKFTMKNKYHFSTLRRPTTVGYQGYTRKATKPVNKDTTTVTIADRTTSKPIEDTKEASDKWTLIPQKGVTEEKVEVKKIPASTPSNKEAVQQINPQIVPLDHATGAIGLDQSNKGLDKDVAEFLTMCNELSFKFWTLANTGLSTTRSVTMSPFGMISTLAMIFLGARGLTSNQMNDILKLDDVVTFNPHLVFQNITDTVTLARGQGIENAAFVRALFADRLKVRRIIPFYKEQTQQFYEGAVVDINFSTAGDILRRRTNLLIRKQTGGRIKDFMKQHTVPLRSPLTALSANVFQTSCDGPDASSEGRDGEMYFAVSQTVKQRKLVPIPAVVWKSGISAGYEPSLDATAVALGDSKRPVSMIMVMPGQQGVTAPGDNLDRLEQRLFGNPSDSALEKLLKVIIPRRVEVQMPKFSHRSIVNVTSALKRMGFDQLFTRTADLKGINGAGHDLYLADMLQMNLFCTCGDENKLGGKHLSETYPGTSSRHNRAWDAIDNVNDNGVNDYLENKEAEKSEASESSRCEDEDDSEDWSASEMASGTSEDVNRIKNLRQKLHQKRLRWFTSPRRTRCRNRRQAESTEKPRMKMDKPFLYLIRHNLTGLILHIGRFNPKNQS